MLRAGQDGAGEVPGSVPDFQGWAKTSKLAILKEQRTEKDQTGRDVYVHVLERRG